MAPQRGYGDACSSSINVVLLPVWSLQVSARMVNFHDPAELIRDFGAYLRSSAPGACDLSTARSFPSDTQGPLARRKWLVYVGLPRFSGLRASSHLKHCFFSWEFFTTLDYEWSIIRGRRTYRWTIWVCS